MICYMYRNVVFLLVVYIHFYDFSNLTAFCTFCHIRIAFEFICDLSFKYSIGLALHCLTKQNNNFFCFFPPFPAKRERNPHFLLARGPRKIHITTFIVEQRIKHCIVAFSICRIYANNVSCDILDSKTRSLAFFRQIQYQ